MPSNPPTVADLVAEVSGQCATALAEAGVYLRAVDGAGNPVTPAILRGLRKGAKCVGLYLANPLALADSDVANLSPFAVERVLAEGMLEGLRETLLHWHRAVQKHAPDAVAAVPMAGGWLAEEKRNIRERASHLEEMCREPYREPSDPFAISNPGPRGTVVPDALPPVSPAGPPHGYPDGYGYGYPDDARRGWY